MYQVHELQILTGWGLKTKLNKSFIPGLKLSPLNDLERKCRILSYGTSECAGDVFVPPPPPPPRSLVSNSKSDLSVPFSQLTLLKNTLVFCANLNQTGKRQKQILKHNKLILKESSSVSCLLDI